MLNNTIKYFLLFIATTYLSFGQAPLGELTSFEIIPGGDTLKIDRKYSNWWYGIHGGMQLNNYFGDLFAPTLNQPNNPFNKFIHYESGNGGGYFIGGLLEWKPRGEKWTGMLGVNFLDNREILSSVLNPSSDTSNNISSTHKQISINPSVKYFLPVEGLHVSAGLLVEMLLSNKGFYNLKYINTGQVAHEYNVDFKEPAFGVGVNVGIGFDFFIADLNRRTRILLTPFADINIRSAVISNDGSSFKSTFVRFGFAVKFGNDDIKIDTLFYNPAYEVPPQYFASVRKEQVLFTSNLAIADLPAGYIDYVKNSEVNAEIGEVIVQKRDSSTNIAAELPKSKEPELAKAETLPLKKEIVIKKGEKTLLTYPTSPTVNATNEIKTYLDRVVTYMQQNPSARVIVIGHSDSRGSLEQNNTRARARAKDVEKYLLSKNIPLGRIIASWQGSLISVAPNDTEAGRRQNRRVEIIVED